MKVSGGGKERANGRGSSTFHGHGYDGNVIQGKKTEIVRTENREKREKEVCEKIEWCVRFI